MNYKWVAGDGRGLCVLTLGYKHFWDWTDGDGVCVWVAVCKQGMEYDY